MLRATLGLSSRVATIEDEMGYPVRVSNGVGDRDRTPLRDAKQWKSLEANGLDHTFEILHERFEREFPHIPVRQSIAAGIVADETVLPCERSQQMAPDGALPVILKMVEPVRRLEQRQPFADCGVGDPGSVAGDAKAYVLS